MFLFGIWDVGVGVVVAFGLLDEGTAQDLVGIATAILVYLVPND